MLKTIFGSKTDTDLPNIVLGTDLVVHEHDLLEVERLMKVIVVLSLVLVLATCFAIVMLTHRQQERFYTTSISGEAQQVVALPHPIDQTATVEMWLETALSQAYTFNFANYQSQFAASSKNFTIAGWNNWYKSLQGSGGLGSVVDSKMSVSAIALARPLLQGLPYSDRGTYTWIFQVPITISYQQLNTVQSETAMYRVYVVRVPVSQNPSGLAIEAIQTISTNMV